MNKFKIVFKSVIHMMTKHQFKILLKSVKPILNKNKMDLN